MSHVYLKLSAGDGKTRGYQGFSHLGLGEVVWARLGPTGDSMENSSWGVRSLVHKETREP